ncbi:MAG: hypothetical protein ACI9K2_003676 [Myxococcota bacterium]
MTLLFLLALVTPCRAASVELDGARYLALRARVTDPVVPEDVPGPGVLRREVVLTPGADGVAVVATWVVAAPEPCWVALRVIGAASELEVDGDWALESAPDGLWAVGWVSGERTLRVRGVVTGDASRGDVALALLPAGAGTVRVVAPGQQVVLGSPDSGVAQLGDGRWSATAGLVLRTSPRTERGPRPTLALAEVGLGLTVSDAELSGRGRVWWTVRQGSLDRVSFRVTGIGPDLDVTGAQVASWKREGDRVEVVLRRSESVRVELELAWSAAVPAGAEASLPVPSIRPQGAFRVETGVQIARLDEVQIVPGLSGAEPSAASELPEVARDLVLGTPTAAFRGQGAVEGSLGLLRFVPVSGPATLVDVAAWTAAATVDGRVLLRGILQVRNDRGAHLRVRPPEGLSLLAAQVGGDTARVSTDGDGWLIPLAKSVETVEGLLSFPVEVALLGEVGSWGRRESRGLVLPTVDADVAVTRVTLHLPPGYSSRLDPGDGPVVADFDRGDSITYGLSVGDPRAVEAEVRFQEAVSAWMRNDFDVAQDQLDKLEEIGAVNENTRRLQSNLFLVDEDSEDAGGDEQMKRRIKDQALARAEDDRKQAAQSEAEAEAAYLAGNYEQAELLYEDALKTGEKLSKLEQKEVREQEVQNVVLGARLSEAKRQRADKAKAVPPPPPPPPVVEEVGDEFAYKAGELAVIDGKELEGLFGLDLRGEAAGDDLDGFMPAPAEEPMGGEGRDQGEVLTKELLERIPTGRSYQSAVSLAQGVTGNGGNPNLGGASTNESTYTLDGANVSDSTVEGEVSKPKKVVVESTSRMSRSIGGGGSGRKNWVSSRDEPVVVPSPVPVATSSKTPAMKGRGKQSNAPAEPTAGAPERSRMAITATTQSIVVPSQGEAVRYQHLLLPADAPLELPVAAREIREKNR